MKKLVKLILTGITAGLVLAGSMKVIYLLTGNEAYKLLYNTDYIPILKAFDDQADFGIIFHYMFCIVSVIGLYILLSFLNMQKKISPYIIVYTVGAGILYFLTLLTNDPPSATHIVSWLYWTMSHVVFGMVVGVMVKKGV